MLIIMPLIVLFFTNKLKYRVDLNKCMHFKVILYFIFVVVDVVRVYLGVCCNFVKCCTKANA